MSKTALKDLSIELLPARTTMRDVRVNVRIRTGNANGNTQLINTGFIGG
jgi:hypothetical protein